ncbi:phage terminase large subunit [Acidocella aquatica]|nr:phage terminase large subunit [Acidocella aquatica]
MMAGLLGFSRHVMAGMARVPARHHELLIEKLDDIVEGRCDRLMVQMPPGSAKSTYGSILFPAYFLSRHKKSQIIATAHTASLADYFGRHVRKTIAEHGERLGLTLAKESRASPKFALEEGGEYFAAGVRGPITGRRADLIIIDDPIKSWAEAESQTFRDALYDWYRAELSARLKPGGRLMLIMTRWHEDDLAGRLMAAEPAWECLRLPAVAERDDAMGRAAGQVLWPEWQDEAAMLRRRQEVGERAFAAMYQQRPRPPDAALFKADAIRILAEAPVMVRTVRAWDLAASLPGIGRNPDYSVGLKLGLAADGLLVVLDVIRFQGSPAQVEARIHAAAKADGVNTLLALPQDPGQAGAAQVAMLTRSLTGFQVVASPETGAKVMRAMPAAAQVDAGRLALLAAPWNENFLSEITAFPDSRKDDQVDALSRAVNTLATTSSQTARRVNVPLLGR